MSNNIILKKSSVTTKVPLASDLAYGELALNYTDGKLYYKKSDGSTIDFFQSGASGGGSVTSVSGTGTVSGLTLTGTVTSSGSLTLGGTLSLTGSEFGSQTANRVLASPNGTSGAPTFRALLPVDIGLGSVENTALSTWAGTTNITTLGTVTSGTWQGSVISSTYGGTGFTSYTLGDILYAGSTTSLNKLVGNTTGTRKFLSSVGVGGVATAPTWYTLSKSDVGLSSVENTALSTWAGTTNITTLGGITTGTWDTDLVVAGSATVGSGTDITPSANWAGQVTINGSGYAGGISLDATGMWVGHNSSTRSLIFATNETERARIEDTGAFGLGVAPDANWDVPGIQVGSAGSFSAWSSATNYQTLMYMNAVQTSTGPVYTTGDTSGARQYVQSPNGHIWGNAGAGTAGTAVSFTNHMTLTPTGTLLHGKTSSSALVLTGTTDYGAELVVDGASSVLRIDRQASDGYLAIFSRGGTLSGYLHGAVDTLTINGGSSGLVFATSDTAGAVGTVRMRLDNAGNAALGTTTSAWVSTARVLHAGDGALLMGRSGGFSEAWVGCNWYYGNSSDRFIGSGYATRYMQLNGVHIWQTSTAAGVADGAVTTKNVARIDTSGNLLVGKTTTTANAGVVQVSNGITFPSTPSLVSDANTIDAYIEGSYTGTLTGMTTAPTTTITYVRVGNMVTLSMPATSYTSNATTFTITGGPTTMRPATQKVCIGRVLDNGVAVAGLVILETTGTITFNASVNGGAFTASGSKGTRILSVSYTLD